MAETKYDVDPGAAMVLESASLADWLIVAPVATAILGSAFTMMLRKRTETQGWMTVALLVFIAMQTIALFFRVLDQGPVTMVMGRWLPPFGIAFTADLTGATLAAAASLAAVAVAIYSLSDMAMTDRRYGFYPMLLLVMAGVCGAFLTGDLFNLYVWFEVLLIGSFGILVLGSRDVQLDGAIKYAFLNLLATTLFLVGVAYIYGLTGTLNMADITVRLRELETGAPLGTIAVLILLAFGMKAAAFPANFWLPASYHAPRISASALFGGLMTKVGFYALVRSLVMLLDPDQDAIATVIAIVAILTMLLGVIGALASNDVRKLFGYLVISGVGTMMAGLAVGSDEGLAGAMLYAVHSILVMTALYLAAGMMNNVAGSFRLTHARGIYKSAPLLAVAFFILFLAVSGLPPFSGFLPKIMLVSASLSAGQGLLAGVILVAGLLTTIAVSRVWIFAFWRSSEALETAATVPLYETGHPPRKNTAGSCAALGFLVVLVSLQGLFSDTVLSALNSGSGVSILNDPTAYIGSVFGDQQ